MWGTALISLLVVTVCSGNVLQNTIDVNRLQGILQEGLKSQDLSSIYYSVKGLKLLNVKISDICDDIKKLNYDLANVEQIFYLTNAAALSGCLNSLKPEVMSSATRVLDKNDATIPELYYAIYSLKSLGKGAVYDKEDGLKNLIQLLKKDDSPANYGYVFALCEHMGCGPWTATHAEGVLLAADESDSRALHFEGGLPVTSMLITTILRTFKELKKPSPLSETQRNKLAWYLVSRRALTSPRGAALLLDAALALAAEQPTPISIGIKGKKFITTEADTIDISITDIIGRPIPGLKPEEVVAQSGTRLADDVVVLSKQPLTQKPNEPGTFVLNLSKIKSQYGMYKIALSAGGKSTNVNIAVLGKIDVDTIEVGIGDVDGTTSPKTTTLKYPNSLKPTEKLTADHLQKVTIKWTVRDQAGKPVLVQQAFVRIASEDDELEAIFVAEPDNAKAYKVELNVGQVGRHLGGVSGAYSVSVYLGDSAVAAPVAWSLGDLHFNFGGDAVAERGSSGSKWQGGRTALPEIAHEFRAASARPARVVSDVFACACAAPLLLLLLLWARLGLNLRNFPATLSAPVFHLALAGSLGLYAMLWLRLTMFETVQYMCGLGALTFLSGHRLLRTLAANKQAAR